MPQRFLDYSPSASTSPRQAVRTALDKANDTQLPVRIHVPGHGIFSAIYPGTAMSRLGEVITDIGRMGLGSNLQPRSAS